MNFSSIKKVVRATLFDSIKNMALFVGCAFLMGFVTVMVAVLIFKQDTYILLGSMFAAISGVCCIALVGTSNFSFYFPQQVKMNISRTNALVGNALASVLTALFGASLLLILSFFEDIIYKSLFNNLAVNMIFVDFSVFHFAGTMLLVNLAFAIIVFTLSSFAAKFNGTAILVAYLALWSMAIAVPKIAYKIVAFFNVFNSITVIIISITAISLVILGLIIWSAHNLLTIDMK